MRAAVPWTLFAASLVVNVVFLSGVLMSGGREPLRQAAFEMPPEDVAAPLALNAAQQSGLAALRDQARAQGADLREVSDKIRQDLLGLLAQAEFDRAAFTQRLHEVSLQRETHFLDLAERLHSYLQDLSVPQREDLLERAKARGFLKSLLLGSPRTGPSPGSGPQKSSN